MKKRFLNILILSAIITTIGFLIDGDAKEPSMIMRFAEFFAMMAVFFLVISIIYFTINYLAKSFKKYNIRLRL